MKSFKIRGKYYPATAILNVQPPFAQGGHWFVQFVDGSTEYLINDQYNDELTVADLCDYFGIR